MSTNCTVIVPAITLMSLGLIVNSAFGSTIAGSCPDTSSTPHDLLETDATEGTHGAALYREAFDALDHARVSTAEWSVEGTSPADHGRWDTTLARSLLEKTAGAMRIAREASATQDVRFTNETPAYGASSRHLVPARRIARLLGMQARMMRIEGSDAEANEILRDINRIAGHLAGEGSLIASLAGSACALQAFEGIEEGLALGAIDAQDATMLRNSMDTSEDQYLFADAASREHQAAIAWLQSNPERAVDAYDLDGPIDDAMLTGLSSACMEIEAILRTGDPGEASALGLSFQADLEAGIHGQLARQMLENHARIIGVRIQMQDRARELASRLDAVRSGVDSRELANAAALYKFAFPHVAALDHGDQEALEAIRSLVAATGSLDGLAGETIARIRVLIEQLGPARGIISRAAECRHCAWNEADTARRLRSPLGEGSWVKPMQALARICMIDAALAIHDGRDADANRAIADGLAISLHLADGSHLLASTVSSAIITDLQLIMKVACSDGDLVPERGLLQERLARMDHEDPLGWNQGRELLIRSRFGEMVSTRFDVEAHAIRDAMRYWSNDRLASLAHVLLRDADPGGSTLLSLANVIREDESRSRDDRMERAGAHFDQLLAIIDDTQPISASAWRRNGLLAVESIKRMLDDSGRRVARSGAE